MVDILEIAERIIKGPKIEERNWDLSIFKKMEELSKKYNLKYAGNNCYINSDDAVAERAFLAAVDFLEQVGIYCITTQRLVQFSRKEVLEAIEDAPKEVKIGKGKDLRIYSQKKVEGNETLNNCPGLHSPFTEEIGPLVVKNYAQIAAADFLCGFNFTAVEGREIFGLPLEAYASIREVALVREGIRMAGRPDMAIVLYPISTRAAALIAPIDPDFGLRRTDGIVLSLLPDIKMEQDLLTAAVVYEKYGSFKINTAGGTIGGFCGGAGGAIIEAIVKAIGGWLVYRTISCASGVYRLQVSTSKKIAIEPERLWADSIAFQALNNWTNTICLGDVGGQSGPGTETHLMEVGINAVHKAVNGANLWTPRQAKARMNASMTPLESEFAIEIGEAIRKSGVTRKDVNLMIEKLAGKVEGRETESGPEDIRECYNLVHHRPTEEYRDIYMKGKKVFEECGVPISLET